MMSSKDMGIPRGHGSGGQGLGFFRKNSPTPKILAAGLTCQF